MNHILGDRRRFNIAYRISICRFNALLCIENKPGPLVNFSQKCYIGKVSNMDFGEITKRLDEIIGLLKDISKP
jgi:hypothetical protein